MGIRENLNEYLVLLHSKECELDEVIAEMKKVDEELLLYDEARVVILKSTQVTQKFLEEHISGIVTKALEIVFLDEAKPFIAKFENRRNSIECDLLFNEDGMIMSPLDSCGFGEADIVSFALRIAYWALGKRRNTLIVDEPFRNLDGERIERASEMMKILSKELNLQMILITHINELISNCDKRFHVVRRRKKSFIT